MDGLWTDKFGFSFNRYDYLTKKYCYCL